MSIVIALIVVLVVGGIIVNLKSQKITNPLAQGETLTPESEVLPEPVVDVVESTPEVVVEPVVKTTLKVETPKMVAKPKKKPQPKKKPIKAKTNA
jgi:outer membrane biosynthesis protein TonB